MFFILFSSGRGSRPPRCCFYSPTLMIRYQAETIDFTITLNNSSSIDKWTDLSKLVVYLYTSQNSIVKFASTSTDGYSILTISEDGKTLSGMLTSANTNIMQGTLYVDIYAVADTQKVCIKSMPTGIEIKYTPIKQETDE